MKAKTFKILAGGLILGQVLDSLITLWGTNNGIGEANPLLAPFAHTWVLPVMKVLAAIAFTWMLWLVAKRAPRTATIGFAIILTIETAVVGLWITVL